MMKMKRSFLLGVVILCGCASRLCATNPEDLKVELRVVGDVSIFHTGESIPLEIAYSSESEQKYRGSFSNRTPEWGGPPPEVTPSDGVINLQDLRQGAAGSFMSSFGYLTSKRSIEKLDLSEWFRFRKAGHYSVRVKSTNISRAKTAEEGGGIERLTLESNAVEFDILEADPEWAAAQQARFEQILNTQSGDNPGSYEALKRLALLDTPASAQRLVQMYLSNPASSDWYLYNTLQLDIVIPLLHAAITNPATDLPSGITQLLADLETRKEFGVIPHSDDPAKQQEVLVKHEERNKVHEKYFQQANDLLLASVERRSGEQRADAIYQAWWNAEGLSHTNGVAPETLARLRTSVLAVQNDLSPGVRSQFAWTAWQTLPHTQVLTLVRKLAEESLVSPNGSYDALQHWCEGAPEECNAAIIERYLETEHKPYNAAILLLTESEHSELDDVLRQRLRDPEMVYGSAASQSAAALVLRAGSRNLMPQVVEFLDKHPTGSCEERADLIGYLFRFNPKAAGKRLNSELQAPNDTCGGQLLRTLHNHRYSDDELPAALAALNSPNLTAAETAALFIQEHGPPSAQEALWGRLESLRRAWQERSAELKDAILGFNATPQREAASLEQAIMSALTRAKSWKLTAGEVEQLKEDCLTDQCRDIADGKMGLGM
jgi:hypothetical protein